MHDEQPMSSVTCPGCAGATTMTPWSFGGDPYRPQELPLHGCEHCGGVWIDAGTLEVLLESASRAAPPPDADPYGHNVKRRTLARGQVTGKIVYRQCPACTQSMLRKNFARISGVIVDTCRHGTYFDRGELDAVLTFVRTGGLALSQKKDAAEQAREQRQRAAIPKPTDPSPGMGPAWMEGGYGNDATFNAFADWASRWLGRSFGR